MTLFFPRRSRPVVLLLACLAFPQRSAAQQCTRPPDAAPPGLDRSRFEVAARWADAFVSSGRLPGLVVAVQRDGDLFVHAAGAYAADTIFRVCSMTKAIVGVAAASLIEDGLLPRGLDTEVAALLPEWADMRVAEVCAPSEPDAACPLREAGHRYRLVPAHRNITVEDLLTHRAGLTYAFFREHFDTSRWQPSADVAAALMRERGVLDGCHSEVERGVDAAENVRRLASIPLVSQPGSAYSYGQDTPLCSAARPRGVSSVSSHLPLWAGHGRARPRARGRLRAAARSASGGEGAPPARHERHGLPPLAGRRGQARETRRALPRPGRVAAKLQGGGRGRVVRERAGGVRGRRLLRRAAVGRVRAALDGLRLPLLPLDAPLGRQSGGRRARRRPRRGARDDARRQARASGGPRLPEPRQRAARRQRARVGRVGARVCAVGRRRRPPPPAAARDAPRLWLGGAAHPPLRCEPRRAAGRGGDVAVPRFRPVLPRPRRRAAPWAARRGPRSAAVNLHGGGTTALFSSSVVSHAAADPALTCTCEVSCEG